MHQKPSYEELQAELEVLKSRNRTQVILDFAGVMLIELDANGIVTLANKKACDILEYEQDEILGKNWFENFLPERIKNEVLPISKKLLSGEIETAEYIENPIWTKSGKERLIYWHNALIKDDQGNIIGHLSSGEDITERKLADHKNTDLHREMLSYIVEQSPATIVITDLSGKIEYVNQAFTRITGYSYEEAIGQNPRILNSGKNNPQLFIDLWDSITSGETWIGDFINTRKNGEEYYERAIISPTHNENGEIVNYFAIKEDITAQRLAEQALKKSEQELMTANAMKDKLFSIIAHDLRNPFNAILGFSDLLIKNNATYDVSERERLISYIIEGAESASSLLENLLTWSRTKTGNISFNPNSYNLKEILGIGISQIEVLAQKKAIELSYHFENDFIIYADEGMLSTVIRNLLTNAIKFTPRAGKVEIYAIKGPNYTTISVKDSGIGIGKEKLKGIFSIVDNEITKGTEKESGSGLGLVLCKEFIEKHKGKIWAESEEGVGSVFSFTIPKVNE